jgi:hypothetical protein
MSKINHNQTDMYIKVAKMTKYYGSTLVERADAKQSLMTKYYGAL